MTQAQWIAPGRTWLRSFVLAGAGLACSLAMAQKIDDIPPAVKNNVAPNFMFMIDNSGSMSNIVMASPYVASTTYACTGTVIAGGTDVELKTVGGAPRIVVGSTTYKHATITAGSVTTRCFTPTATYGAALLADSGSGGDRSYGGGYLNADYTGNYLNWYFGSYGSQPQTGWTDRKPLTTGTVQSRMEVARNSAKTVVSSLPLPPTAGASAAVRVGLSTYNGSDGGELKVKVADLTSAWATTLNTAIGNLSPSGATPLATTLADIGRYFSSGYDGTVMVKGSAVNIDTFLRQRTDASTGRNSCLKNADCSATAAADRPVQQWCQRSSVFMMTDGRPTQDNKFAFNPYLKDYDGDCSGLNASTCLSGGGFDRKNAGLGRTYEQTTSSDYMDDIAMALFDVDLRPDLTSPTGRTKTSNLTTYMIGFADPFVQNDELLKSTARQGGGKFIAATDGPALIDAFQDVISDALAKDAAAAAVAVTNAQITAGSVGYASSYNSGSWYGDLEAYSLDLATGLQTGATQWSARDKLNLQTPASRKIATYISGTGGVGFSTTNGDSLRVATASLSDNLINYTRGVKTLEGTTFRSRTYLLGDVINAEPVVVNYTTGETLVFQAANDGMLHVFDGRVTSTVTTRGQELWAYIPQLVHSKLANRAATNFEHEFLVDGTPTATEVSGTGTGTVTRILVGGLAKGGAGYYALDISTPGGATEANIASKVLWEFKPTNMGYSFGNPLVVKTSVGWRVVVTSGYRNDTATGGLGGDGIGHVWVLNPSTGAIEKEFTTPAGYGSPSASLGLAHLGKMANTVADAEVRYLYGGDLQGNLWRVDLDATTLSTLVRVAAVTAPNGTAQPITVPPVVGPVAGAPTKNYIYFGTGQYLSTDDVPGTSSPNAYATQVETFYGIVDDPAIAAPAMPTRHSSSSCPTGGGTGTLVCQSATTPTTSAPATASTNAVDLSTKRGFYMDVPVTNGRVNTQAALTVRGTLVFVVNKPSNVLCDPGGSSYFFQLNAATGGAVPKVIGGNTYFDAGFVLAGALSSRPVFITTATGTRAIFRLSDKTTESRKIDETENTAALFRRIYKRQLN